MVEDAEGGGDADNPEQGERDIGAPGRGAGQDRLKELSANPGNEQENSRERHADKELDLMMEQAAVIEDASDADERGSGEDAGHLCACGAVERNERSKENAAIDGQATEQGHGREMDLARTGMIHHANAKSELADGNGETERSNESDGEGDQARVHRLEGHRFELQRSVSMRSRIAFTCCRSFVL